MHETIVVNSTPIIVLNAIGQLNILKALYQKVVIPGGFFVSDDIYHEAMRLACESSK